MYKKYYLLFLLIATNLLFGACTPAGTAGNDMVTCTGNINTYQQFYGGDDTVTLTNVTDVNYTGVYWLDESHSGNPVTDGNDTFISNGSRFFWVFGFRGDDTFTIDRSQFNNAYGDTNPDHVRTQRGNDTFLITASTSYGYILGGNDNDVITIRDSNVSNVASGYSDIYPLIDYSPFDGNDTILLDHVNFTATLYWDANSSEGVVSAGRGDDTITFRHGGEAYYVYGGHGNDKIEVYDDEHFNACITSSQITDPCGIYGDETYASEPNATLVPMLHGDDEILLHGGDISNIVVQGGDGSDRVLIETGVVIEGALLNGGDDRSHVDNFMDSLIFDQWNGEVNGSNLQNWEHIIFDNASTITFRDYNVSAGYESGVNSLNTLPYGLIILDNSTWTQYHNFTVNGNLHNEAIINTQNGDTPGTVLMIENNYTAEEGIFYMDTVLDGATPSLSDRLLVKGDTSGITTLSINNIGGIGAQTPEGDNNDILVVEVEGNSDGIFMLDDTLYAGEYLYKLYKGSNGNWYLKSEKKNPMITLTSEANVTVVYVPERVHIDIRIENTGNVVLTGVTVHYLMPDASSHTLVLESGDNNGNGIFDIGEVWMYSSDYDISQAEVDAGTDLKGRIDVTTNQTIILSEDTLIHINCICDGIESDRAEITIYWWISWIFCFFFISIRYREINSF